MFGFLKIMCSSIRSIFVYDVFETMKYEIDACVNSINIELTEVVIHTCEPCEPCEPQMDIITPENFVCIDISDPYDLTKIIKPEHLISENTKYMSSHYTHDDVLEYINRLSDKCLE